MKVAIVHDWFTAMRGGERCVEAFCEVFPDADLFTLLHFRGAISPVIERMRIHTSFVQRLPFLRQYYRHYLPLFPFAIERFDLRGYDLILSSSHCVAKGVLRPSGAFHVSYTYTPMRYAWDLYDDYFKSRRGRLKELAIRATMAYLRRWDRKACSRVDRFVAISHHVADRISRHYGVKSEVIYPPVDFHRFCVSRQHEGFYLVVGAFAPYKRVDLAIEACNQARLPLKIIGSGQDEPRLKRMAGRTVEFLGWQPDHVVRDYYARCKALLFPGEEDFGIVPLEAMACGKPVIAYAKGGAVETVAPINPRPTTREERHALNLEPRTSNRTPPTGVFFYDQTPEALIEAIECFERYEDDFDPDAIRAQVEPFDREHFKQRIRRFIDQNWQEFRLARQC